MTTEPDNPRVRQQEETEHVSGVFLRPRGATHWRDPEGLSAEVQTEAAQSG